MCFSSKIHILHLVHEIFVNLHFLCCLDGGGATGEADLDREIVFDITPAHLFIHGLRGLTSCHINPRKDVRCLCAHHPFAVLCEKVKRQAQDGMFSKHQSVSQSQAFHLVLEFVL